MDLTANQQTFVFPLLKNSDIIQCMSEMSIDLTLQEIQEPNRHKDRVRAVFVTLVELGLGATEDELTTPSKTVEEKCESLPYPELHEDSFSELKLLKKTMELMKICGLHDFGWKDFHAPTSKRFRRQLSGAINLLKYREDCILFYEELNLQRNELLAALQEIGQENSMLNKQLEATKIDTDNKWKEIEEVENDCAEIETEIAQQNKLQASIRQESTELKKKANELKDKIATMALGLQEAQAEERKLSSRIVQSPARIKREVSEATKSLEIEREAFTDTERAAQLVKLKVAHVSKSEGDMLHAMRVMEEVKEEKNKYKSSMEEVFAARCTVENNQKNADGLNDEREKSERELHRIGEKIAHMRKQGKTKIDAAHETLGKAQHDLVVVDRDRRDGLALVETSEAGVREMEEKLEREEKRTESEISELIGAFEKIESVIREQDRQFMAAIKAS